MITHDHNTPSANHMSDAYAHASGLGHWSLTGAGVEEHQQVKGRKRMEHRSFAHDEPYTTTREGLSSCVVILFLWFSPHLLIPLSDAFQFQL